MTLEKYPDLPVLLVDDEKEWLRNLSLALQRNLGITHFMTCQDSREAIPLLAQQKASLAILDMTMPYLSGRDLLVKIREAHPEIPVVILTGRSEIELAVTCMREGAFDYFIKTEETDRLFASVRHALEMGRIQNENQRLKKQVLGGQPPTDSVFADIVTCSQSMQDIFRYIEAISVSSEPVLITGESGVGKELLAKAVHRVSTPEGPWVAVNVAGLDDNAFSDSLFGHVKGAFTGADKPRAGLVEKAAGGVLFLDEIGDLEPVSQIKLLRFIQEGEYYPLGSDQPKKVRARLVFATNHDLVKKVDERRYRRDLYYRLQTHLVAIPPLRERPKDIPLLLDHYLAEAASNMNKEIPAVSKDVLLLLAGHDFPGNVRELRGIVIDAMSRHSSGMLSLESFSHLSMQGSEARAHADKHALADQEELPTIKEAVHELVLAALAKTGGNRTAAAKILGISQPALSKRLKNMENSDE